MFKSLFYFQCSCLTNNGCSFVFLDFIILIIIVTEKENRKNIRTHLIVKWVVMKSLRCWTEFKVIQKAIQIIYLLQDSETEFIEEPVPDNKDKSHQILTPKDTVHVNVINETESPCKKLKPKVTELKQKCSSTFVKSQECIFEVKYCSTCQITLALY